MTRHTDSSFEGELQQLSSHVVHMGTLAAGMLRDASRALFTRDPELARRVIRDDDRLDVLEVETDRLALAVVARRSPVGEDLRFVFAVVKAVTDLERVGDYAANIAERALDLMGSPGLSVLPEIQQLADAALAEFEAAVAAWRSRDAAAARALKPADRDVDALNRAVFARLVQLGREHPDQFERVLAMGSICRYLERIGDHAVNLGERVVFWVEAAETRHGG